MRLVITEKPSVAAALAAALGVKNKKDGYMEGGGYLISWCVGHLVELAEAAAYGEQYKKWSYDSLPILPQPWQYTVFKDRQKQFKILKDLMCRSDISEVVNACDAGREGELIFRLVYHAAGCDKPFSRLWISSMEKSAIKKGFAELKPGEAYDALYASALCRAKADWIIGINATRLFSVLHGKTLNVGRVQTPTLKILADRDTAITSFKKETYHIVRLDVGGAEAASARISDAADAEALKTACESSQAVCVSVKRERKTEQPPRLFDLTGLQREANRIYGYTAKQTLDLAQALYEKRLLTYPRTDSNYLTDDMGDTAVHIAALLVGKLPFMKGAAFTPDIARTLDSKKVSDHHAIIPTMELAKADLAALPESERNILTLAGARLLFAAAEPHIFDAVTAVFSCADTEFTAKGKTVLCDGWKELERRYRATLKGKPDAEGDEENELILDAPTFAEGQSFDSPAARVTAHDTHPPKPHTEASLLSAMERAGSADTDPDAERKGLGTPATRAAVIEKLVKSGFVQRKGKQLIPTQKGNNTRFLEKAIEYVQTPPVKHTSNKWEKTDYEWQLRSNAVYQMRYHVYENTRYDRQAQKSVPYSWSLTWSVYTNGPNHGQNVKIAGQERKTFSDKAAMEKYLAGRIKAYDRLFTETMPPVPKEYAEPFKVNGLLLPGYAIEGEPPQHTAPQQAAQPTRPDPEKVEMDAAAMQAAPLTVEPPQPQPVIPINLTAEKPAEKLKEITDRLEQGITELFDSERYKEY